MKDIILYDSGYEIKPTVEIQARPEVIWRELIDIEDWWVDSNDEHQSLTIESEEKELKKGTEITVREKIAGIPCEAKGTITEIQPGKLVVWEATYRLFGCDFLQVPAGVRWKLSGTANGSSLTANVWATFSDRMIDRLLFVLFKAMGGIKKDYDHAMKELQYLKSKIER